MALAEPTEHRLRVYVCGAVSDILREFKRKIEKRGVEVIRMDEWSSTRSFNPPIGTEAVVIGIDQTGHADTPYIVDLCKRRGLPYVLGELRKWSLIGPRLVEAGIIKDMNASNEPGENMATNDTEMALLPMHATTNEEASKREAAEAVHFLLETLKGKVKSGVIHINDGHAHAEFEYVARMTLDV